MTLTEDQSVTSVPRSYEVLLAREGTGGIRAKAAGGSGPGRTMFPQEETKTREGKLVQGGREGVFRAGGYVT